MLDISYNSSFFLILHETCLFVFLGIYNKREFRIICSSSIMNLSKTLHLYIHKEKKYYFIVHYFSFENNTYIIYHA